MNARIRIIESDITILDVDAIVNAADTTLLGGGGVDGAIHRAAGPGLLTECRALPDTAGVRCPTGQARITGGHDLVARHVIHTVGPIWHGGIRGEADVLARCYRDCLALAELHGLARIAFPAISCGVYGYPAQAACAIAVQAVDDWTKEHDLPQRVIFCCFGTSMARIYRERLANRSGSPDTP